MGCAQSRVDNEEAVARCKERRNVIKEAVSASKAFAAGHFAYAIALKNTGAALSDYGHGESDQKALDDVLDQQHYEKQSRNNVDPAAPQPPPPPPIENLPPPPPPLPKFSPSPIKRAISLPTMAVRGRKVQTLDAMAIEEEEEDEEEEEEVKGSARATARKVEEEEEASPRTPENVGNNGRKRLETTPDIVSASPGNSMAWDYFFMVENMPGPNLDEREMRNGYENQNHHFQFNEDEEEERSGHKVVDEMEPKTPEKVEEVEEEEEDEEEEEEEEEEEDEVGVEAKKKKKGKAKIEHSNTAPPEFRRVVTKTTTASSVNLMKILDDIDDRFLKASECAQEVSKMLEATRLHYHSNFADNRGIELLSEYL